MTNKQIAALISTGVIIFTTVLCWPGDYTTISSFYRAVVINIASVFISEIPKFKQSLDNLKLNIAKIILTLAGFAVLAIGIMNTSRPYDANNLPQEFTIWEWIYFLVSFAVCGIAILNFIEVLHDKSDVPPKAVDCAPNGSISE
ncbi:MAG: hypothetical protein IJA45_02655 [Oscillospiraceae bacterium]|nr:hypothetical protein [Oscillospiraceae bacterium]